jgi:hypothetical protein
MILSSISSPVQNEVWKHDQLDTAEDGGVAPASPCSFWRSHVGNDDGLSRLQLWTIFMAVHHLSTPTDHLIYENYQISFCTKIFTSTGNFLGTKQKFVQWFSRVPVTFQVPPIFQYQMWGLDVLILYTRRSARNPEEDWRFLALLKNWNEITWCLNTCPTRRPVTPDYLKYKIISGTRIN